MALATRRVESVEGEALDRRACPVASLGPLSSPIYSRRQSMPSGASLPLRRGTDPEGWFFGPAMPLWERPSESSGSMAAHIASLY